MLDGAEQKGLDRIVSWLPDGVSFKVHNSATFVTQVLPHFFLQTKYKSFQRQLNIWGFERIASGPNKGGYTRAENFVRGRVSLVKTMIRRSKKPRSAAAADSSIRSDRPTTLDPEMAISSSSIVDEEQPLEIIAPSTYVSVSVNGDDEVHHRSKPQKGLMEDLTESDSEGDDPFVPFSLDDILSGPPDVDFIDDETSLLFEDANFFPDGDKDDPLFRHLEQALDGNDEVQDEESFTPWTPPSSAHPMRGEEHGFIDWLVTSKRRSTYDGTGITDTLAVFGGVTPLHPAPALFKASPTKGIQYRSSVPTYASKWHGLRPSTGLSPAMGIHSRIHRQL
jgi:HSF-type DNA-binding